MITNADWSASKDEFQICRASLQGDVETVVALMPSKAISADDFRAWPILDWVRDDPKVNEMFEQVYGEPMRSGTREALIDTKRGAEAEVETASFSPAPGDITRH